MSANIDQAKQFFEACETGEGWEKCQTYCLPDATFSSQTGALADIATLADYCEWMKNLLTPIPDGHYELKFFAEDQERHRPRSWRLGMYRHPAGIRDQLAPGMVPSLGARR